MLKKLGPAIVCAGLFVSLLASRSFARANDEQSLVVPFGHNMSSTSYMLRPGHCTIGIQALACGITEKWNLGTSPWLFHDYNMYSAIMRFQIGSHDAEQQKAIQVGYFKTFPSGDESRRDYEMEAGWATYVHTFFVNDHYSAHLNGQVMYYWNDEFPFSMRRPWPEKRPVQLNLTVLNEVQMSSGWYVNAEVGVVGVYQSHPQILLAMTIEYRTSRWLFHGGFSQIGTPQAYGAPTRRADYQQWLGWSEDGFHGGIEDAWARYDYSIHPEFVIQYYF